MKKLLLLGIVTLCGCAAGPKVTTVQELDPGADAPYDNILVVSLFKSFDARRYMEKEIVAQLTARGVKATPSTSLMDTRTPVTRETFVAMVEELDSDAVLVTHLVDLETSATMTDMNPQSTHNIRATYYYNVWSVELTEYVEPQGMNLAHSVVLASQVYSVKNKQPIWAIEADATFKQDFDQRGDISILTDEAKTIASHMSRDGLLAP
jgi:hypothetical protein